MAGKTSAKPIKPEENVATLFSEDFDNIGFDVKDDVPAIKIEAGKVDPLPNDNLTSPMEEAPTKPKLTDELKEKFLTIFDAIMFEGSYKEIFKIGKRYKVCFRSRSAGEEMNIAQRLDTMSFKTILAYQNQSALLTLAYSLVYFGNDDLSQMDLKDRYEYISNLSTGIIPVLSNILVEFDATINEAMEYGRENF